MVQHRAYGGIWWIEHYRKSNSRWTVCWYFKAFCFLFTLVLFHEFLEFIISVYSIVSFHEFLEFIISVYSIVSFHEFLEFIISVYSIVSFFYEVVVRKCYKEQGPQSSRRWTMGCYSKACSFLLLILVSNPQLLEEFISVYSIASIFLCDGDAKKCWDKCFSHPRTVATHKAEQKVPPGVSHVGVAPAKDNLDKLEGLLPEVKERILQHLDYEDIFMLKSLSKPWKAFIDRAEFIQALELKAKPALTACSFSIDQKGVWQWAAVDPKWKSSTSGPNSGKWRKLPPLTFLPPNCDPDPDLFKQFLVCAKDGLVCINFSKSPHEERLIVFNPLSREWKELPPLLHRRNPVLMHMYVDQSSKSYRILVAGSSASGEESLSRITEVYDSRTGLWERVGDLPGPAFAVNEYQSGVLRNGNIFCIGFVELGDELVKGILGYNVEEGIWSTKWTDRGLPNSPILQLVENDGDLFLFSERDNGPVTEHWVDRIEWTQRDGDDEEKTYSFTPVNILKKIKSGGRSLELYTEFALVPFSESRLCIYNTVEHTGEVFDIEDPETSEALPALPEGFGGELGLFSLNPLSFAMEPRFSSKA